MTPRLNRLRLIVYVLLGILCARLVWLQVVKGARYSRLSDRNRIREIITPGPRGRIFDRDGRIIADTRPSLTATVVPTELGDSALPLLARILSLPLPDLAERIGPVEHYASPVTIERDLTIDEVARIEENQFRLPGAQVRVDAVRSYPVGTPYCHVLGHLGEVNEDELNRDTALRRFDLVGRDGIEAQYEALLRGAAGRRFVEVDARGQELGPLPEKRPEPPVAGKDLRLTLSARMQELAWRLTADYDRAAVVGIEVKTGGVVCLVSRPGFDPNIFITGVTGAKWDSLVSDPSKPFFNRAVASGYPPGSTIKPLLALAALAHGVITTATRFQPCTGSYKYGNRVFRCTGAHGSLDLIPAIAYSCNVYFYQLGLRLGLDSLASYASALGLGQLAGIDLPAEKPGIVPNRSWLDQRYGKGKWGAGTLLNFAIGQGEILTTPLQMAVLFAAVANNGLACRPHVLAEVDSAGRPVYQVPVVRHALPVRPQDLADVKLALTRVVEYGTGRLARMRELTIAGKTGTAQNPPRPDHAWFVGYAPADDPEVVFAVLVENAGHGGAVAAPIAARLMHAWFFPDESAARRADSAAVVTAESIVPLESAPAGPDTGRR